MPGTTTLSTRRPLDGESACLLLEDKSCFDLDYWAVSIAFIGPEDSRSLESSGSCWKLIYLQITCLEAPNYRTQSERSLFVRFNSQLRVICIRVAYALNKHLPI